MLYLIFDKIVVHFKLENNLIIIPVQINNSSTLNFILDTGLKNTIITELNKIESIKEKGHIIIKASKNIF